VKVELALLQAITSLEGLVCLKLKDCGFKEEHFSSRTKFQETLRRLYLDENIITDKVISQIGPVLSNLHLLSLRFTSIAGNGPIPSLIEKSQTLADLDLSHSYVNDEFGRSLVNGLQL